jgi:quercetin dioxygenase-like cupin family protein
MLLMLCKNALVLSIFSVPASRERLIGRAIPAHVSAAAGPPFEGLAARSVRGTLNAISRRHRQVRTNTVKLPPMRQLAVVLSLLCAACVAQVSAPIPDDQVPQRKEILRNQRVSVSLLQLPPGDATPMHKHSHDTLAVFVNGGRTRNTVLGKLVRDRMAVGETDFHNAGYTHAVTNYGKFPLREVVVDFADAQGNMQKVDRPDSRSCNPGSNKCVDENYLFCTVKVCVEEVTMAAGAVSTRHSHATDHMLIAISDYDLTDEVEGKGRVTRSRKSGEVEYIPAGITHRLTNVGKAPARFTVVIWR